jgi:hypothetical protein
LRSRRSRHRRREQGALLAEAYFRTALETVIIDFETFLPNASADPKKPCTPDIERYLMAHSSSIHANYGDWLVPDLKAGIECIPDPLVDEADTEASVSGVLSALAAAE